MNSRNDSRIFSSKIVIVIVMIFVSLSVSSEEIGWPEPVEDNLVFGRVIADQLEYRNNEGSDILRWDIQAWYGTDHNKIWSKFEGEDLIESNEGDLELQVLYSRMVAPFWDFQIGVRYDLSYGSGPEQNRGLAVIGFQGLAPYRFELEPALYVSEDGDVSARLTATYDVLFTQRLILQPRFEINASASSTTQFGIGSGFNDVELGLRLRYEYRREIAPYVGFNWSRSLGNTADIARNNGENVDVFTVIAGIRVWF